MVPGDDPLERSAYLRGVSDQFMLAVSEVTQKEQLKRGVEPSDGQFAKLAVSVREAVERLLQLAVAQETLAHEAVASNDHELTPIKAAPPPHSLAQVLERWRAVEREIAATDPDSPEARSLLAEFDALRKTYAEALRAIESR